MRARKRFRGPYNVRRGERGEAVRLAFEEFATVPVILIVVIGAAGLGMYVLDKATPAALADARAFLERRFYPSSETTGRILQTIAQTVIT